MEHKIDQLFKEKLQEEELFVPPEVWEKIEKSFKKEEKKVPWWQLITAIEIAASVLFAFFWFFIPQKVAKKQQILVHSSSFNNQKREDFSPKNNALFERKTTYSSTPKVQNLLKSDKRTKTASLENLSENQKAFAKQTILANENASSKQIAETNLPKDEKKEVLQPKQEIEEIKIAKTAEKPKEDVLILELSSSLSPKTDTMKNEKPKKRSLFAKVFRQLKNIKNGEDVQWQELGLKERILAQSN